LDKVILEIVKPHYFVLCSSREIVSLKKNLKLAGHLVFNIKSNESSLAPQFKWLEYTFNSIFILRVIMSELLTTIHVLIKHRLERLAFALVQNFFLSAIFILENFFAVFAMRTW
jgi:hypothetical protein